MALSISEIYTHHINAELRSFFNTNHLLKKTKSHFMMEYSDDIFNLPDNDFSSFNLQSPIIDHNINDQPINDYPFDFPCDTKSLNEDDLLTSPWPKLHDDKSEIPSSQPEIKIVMAPIMMEMCPFSILHISKKVQKPHKNLQSKSRNSFTETQKIILNKWYSENIKNPYLNTSDLLYLTKSTGLSPKQVRTYMTNLRCRVGWENKTFRYFK